MLRREVILRQDWETLRDPWLKWTSVPALGVAGFGIVGLLLEERMKPLVAFSATVIDVSLLMYVSLLAMVMLGFGMMLSLIGGTKAPSPKTNAPMHWFVPAFLCSWLGNVALYSLLLDGIFLTFYAHMKTT